MKPSVLMLLVLSLGSLANAGDKATLEKARSFYNNRQYEKAVDTYAKIQKSSDHYLEALEEKAQSLGQMGKYAEALSQIKSTMAPQFTGLVSANSFLTEAITELKTCDYKSVLETSKKFKETFTPRLKNLDEVAGAAPSTLREKAFAVASQKGAVTIESMGPLVRELPRNMVKDAKLAKLVKNQGAFEKQLQRLAKDELQEIDRVIGRLQVAEVEVEHRLNVMSVAGKRHKEGGYEKSSDVLVFPADDDEVWIDEIGNYQAQIETCPELSRRAGL